MKLVLIALLTSLISVATHAQATSMTIACSASVSDKAGDTIWDWNENETENQVIEISDERIEKDFSIEGPKGFKFDLKLVSSDSEVYFNKGTGVTHKPSGVSTGVFLISPPKFFYILQTKDYTAFLVCFPR